jgi:hypothetical protein
VVWLKVFEKSCISPPAEAANFEKAGEGGFVEADWKEASYKYCII